MKKKKDTFHEIGVVYHPIVNEPNKGITLLYQKEKVKGKMFQEFQRIFHQTEKQAKEYLKDLKSKGVPGDFMVLLGETIKLMIEDTLIPYLNPTGKVGYLSTDDDELYVKFWGQGELLRLIWMLELMGSSQVNVYKLKKSEVIKRKKSLEKELQKQGVL